MERYAFYKLKIFTYLLILIYIRYKKVLKILKNNIIKKIMEYSN
jgi:hypothetical protein